jgi:hypothetical protein
VIAGLIAIALLVPESRDPRPGRIDIGGVLLSIVGLVVLVYGIIDGGEHGFDRARAWGSLIAGAVVLGGFVWYESRVRFPSLDVRLFRNPAFSAAVASVGLVFFAAMGVFFFSTFYLQLVRGYTPLQTGLLLLPFAAAQLIFAPRSASLVRRFGPKAVCTAGLLLVSAGLSGMVFFEIDTPLWIVGASYFVMGAGMANVMPPATESVMSTLPREKAGVGSAVSNTIRQVGGSLGIAVLGSVLASSYRTRWPIRSPRCPSRCGTRRASRWPARTASPARWPGRPHPDRVGERRVHRRDARRRDPLGRGRADRRPGGGAVAAAAQRAADPDGAGGCGAGPGRREGDRRADGSGRRGRCRTGRRRHRRRRPSGTGRGAVSTGE